MYVNQNIECIHMKLVGTYIVLYIRYIMDNVKDFQELVSLSESQLSVILSNDSNAKLLWNGLHRELDQPLVGGDNSALGKTKITK